MLKQLNKLIKKLTAFALMMLLALPAYALDLQAAKQQGLVGEQTNGYLGVVVKRSDVNALVAKVNSKRKQVYIKLAKKNKLSLEQIAMLAGEKAIKKTASGNYIQDANGNWVKK